VRVIKKAWTSDVFSHKGENWQFPPEGGSTGHPAYAKYGKGQDEHGIVREIGIAPKCYQDPHPPIYGGFAASMRTVDFWAQEEGKMIVLSDNLDFCEQLNNRYIQTAEKHGRTGADASAWGGFLMLTDDKDRAEYLMKEHMWFWDEWFIPLGQRPPNVLIGSADEIADKIGRAHDRLGFDELFLMFGQGHLEPEANQEELEKFISKVAPRFSTKAADGTLV
jgi:alkanesulfonate monooxygenase SsuD/methylene tetrahydromethanopterin reductase-like flavin-dependent oxidoreductase (luciferase family)